MGEAVTELPYPDADKELHIPGCGGTVISDLNKMPQWKWHHDTQAWDCEGCGARVQRTFIKGSGWSAWAPVT